MYFVCFVYIMFTYLFFCKRVNIINTLIITMFDFNWNYGCLFLCSTVTYKNSLKNICKFIWKICKHLLPLSPSNKRKTKFSVCLEKTVNFYGVKYKQKKPLILNGFFYAKADYLVGLCALYIRAYTATLFSLRASLRDVLRSVLGFLLPIIRAQGTPKVPAGKLFW